LTGLYQIYDIGEKQAQWGASYLKDKK